MIYKLISLALLIAPFHQIVAQDTEAPVPINPNQTLLKSIYFGGGSDYIDPVQEQALQEFIFVVENINRYEVIIHSFTDNIGGRAYNQWLSQQRGAAVLRILEQLDIEIDLILKADFGEDDPTFSNDTIDGKLRNRRVDVILRPLTF